MGRLGGGNGGNWPPDGSDLPGLPPEWGPLTVPDDPAELAEEAAQVRRELRQQARRQRWRRRLSWLTGRTDGAGAPLRLSIAIISLAMVATLGSLFLIAGPGRRALAPVDQPTQTAQRTVLPDTVPALDLLDGQGQAVPLIGLLPAVILMPERCSCRDLIEATAEAAPTGVTVVVVAAAQPDLGPPGTVRARALADPAGGLRSAVRLKPPAGVAAVLLVDGNAKIVKAIEAAATVEVYRDDLATLATR